MPSLPVGFQEARKKAVSELTGAEQEGVRDFYARVVQLSGTVGDDTPTKQELIIRQVTREMPALRVVADKVDRRIRELLGE